MSDIRRQLNTARTERDALRRENMNLRHILGDIAPEYAEAFSLLCDIALNPTTGDDLGTTTTPTFESHAPRHNSAAYHIRNEERRHQRQRAKRLRDRIARLTGTISDQSLDTYDHHSSDAPLPRSTAGVYVYFCQSTRGGPIKIGVAADPKNRLHQLQGSSPTPLRMIALIPGGYDIEKRLHEHFSPWRLHGEWFDDRADGLNELVSKAQSHTPYRQHLAAVPDPAQPSQNTMSIRPELLSFAPVRSAPS